VPSLAPSEVPGADLSAVQSATSNCVPSLCPGRSTIAVPGATPISRTSVRACLSPSSLLSYVPSIDQSVGPSLSPSYVPSLEPNLDPSGTPSSVPCSEPSSIPSSIPSSVPRANPSGDPSIFPSSEPS
jgi:insulin receptor substrate 1